MHKRIVSNTSPIINLACIGQLDILRRLYGTILIPQAVYDEIVRPDLNEPGSTEVRHSNWIQVHPISNRHLVEALKLELDPGEAEAIGCALEIKADWLLLDERLGRSVAHRMGVRHIGLLGILIEAKRQGLIAAIKPMLDELKTKAGFWIAPPLYARVLEAAGETIGFLN
ncbi:MAG: DUF3368 domain-containing protein [Proteobacteria bacterium]|nr:DUF3368 domain-containing protein [Pseudomonadota bacterium]